MYIKREDAIKAVLQKPAIHGSDGSWYHADDIKDALENAPSADRDIEILKAEAYVKGIDSERKRLLDSWSRPQGEVDAIDRDALIDYCLKLIDVERKQGSDVMNYGQERVNQTETIIDYIEHMPHVNTDRQQAEWKSVKASIYPYGYDVECSICGHRMGSSFGYKYCPMCGAQMKGADDDSKRD